MLTVSNTFYVKTTFIYNWNKYVYCEFNHFSFAAMKLKIAAFKLTLAAFKLKIAAIKLTLAAFKLIIRLSSFN